MSRLTLKDADNFNMEELTILIEAMEAWPERGLAHYLIETVSGAMDAKINSETDVDAYMKERSDGFGEAQNKAAADRETATLIKAKLITMKRRKLSEGINPWATS